MPALPAFPPTASPFPEGARATRVPSKYIPQLSLKERDRRWDRARKAMLMAGLDAFVFLGNDIYWGMGMANMRYMFQVDAHLGAEALFPLAGESVVWRGAGKIARKVLDAMIESVRPGVPEALVYAEMIKTQIANGGEPNIFNLFTSGPVEHPRNELWHMLHGAEQPLAPTMRPLAEGDLIATEWHTKYGGYRCHTEFSVYLGKRAPKELLNIWNVSVECLHASKDALVAGKTIREALEIIRRPAAKAGLDWVELGFHAMGTASPEFPTVVYAEGYGSNTLNGYRIMDMVLEEGMCFGNNVDLHDSRWKPDLGTMLSNFMVVRPNKAECLIGTPTEFIQKG